jgi:hypothetical protein
VHVVETQSIDSVSRDTWSANERGSAVEASPPLSWIASRLPGG